MDRRDLAVLGEKTLAVWASQVSITCNRASQDKTGWDYLLEFPLESSPPTEIVLPLDRRPPPIQCLVQVKSTDGRTGRRDVKLSNWERFVKSPLPCFYLALEFDNLPSVQRAYLVHVDERHAGRVLKRLRELDCQGEPKLHRKTLRLTYGESHQLASLDGEGLEDAIRTHLVCGMEDYTTRKMQRARSVGYGEGGYRLHVVTERPKGVMDLQEMLLDFVLGLQPQLRVIGGELWDDRFGITASRPDQVLGKGILELAERKPSGNATVCISLPGQEKQLRIQTTVYAPQGLQTVVHRHRLKVRLAAPNMDLELWPSRDSPSERLRLNFRVPDPNGPRDLGTMRYVAQFACLLHEAALTGCPLHLAIYLESKHLYDGELTTRAPFTSQVYEYLEAIARAWTIAKHFDVHDKVELRPGELISQAVRLMMMAEALGPSRPSIRSTYWSSDQLTKEDNTVCIPYVTDVLIGQYYMAAGLAFVGRAVPTGETSCKGTEFRFLTRDVRWCTQRLCDRDGGPTYTFRQLIQSVIDEYEEEMTILLLEGINKHLLDSESPSTGGMT